MCSEIKARVVPLDDLHIRVPAGDHLVLHVRLTVQDEDEISGIVQAVIYEKLKILPPKVALGIRVCDERPVLWRTFMVGIVI